MIRRAITYLAGTVCISLAFASSTYASELYSQEHAQGWTAQEAERWYTLPQGSRLIKDTWLWALKSSDGKPFFTRQALTDYGYLYRTSSQKLPLGFTTEKDEKGSNWIGLNCAACHTSELRVGTNRVPIHGGQSMADFQTFLGDLIDSVDTVATDNQKFEQFAGAVTSGSRTPERDTRLKEELAAWLKLRKRIQSSQPEDHLWGRGRADAVGAILAKTAAVVAPDSDVELPKSNAPVSYPFIWNTNQQALLQHNGVVSNGENYGPFKVTKLGALIRNWTEVLGVFGHAKMDPETKAVTSSIHLENLLELEQILARLKSPRWPDVFGKLSGEKIDKGREVYQQSCASCHSVMDPDDLDTDIRLKTDMKDNKPGPFLLMQPLVDISVTSKMLAAAAPRSTALIGTDPMMACNSTLHAIPTGMLKGEIKQVTIEQDDNTTVYGDYAITTDVLTTLINKEIQPRLGELGIAYLKDQAEGGVDMVRSFVSKTFKKIYSGASYDPQKPGSRIDQFLAACADQTVLAHMRNSDSPLPAYKARPLNGIWATAPYLHNGSVPTLADLLKPQSQRPAKYGYLDGLFDPERVGLVDRTGEKGATVLEVYDDAGLQIPGNWNGGHEYGTQLSDVQKLNLLEFLKSL